MWPLLKLRDGTIWLVGLTTRDGSDLLTFCTAATRAMTAVLLATPADLTVQLAAGALAVSAMDADRSRFTAPDVVKIEGNEVRK